MVTGMLRLSEAGDQAADLAGGEPDQFAVMVMPLLRPGKLSTAAGAPFERR
jgi:hypothetical protein